MGSRNTAKISVLQWNEKLQSIKEPSHGLFLFRIKKQTQCKKRIKTNDQNKNSEEEDCSVYVFDTLKLSTPDSTEWVVSKAMESLSFLLSSEITSLRRKLSAYLFRYFRINRDDIEKKPRIVIVVDLHLSKAGGEMNLKSGFNCVSGELKDEEVKKIRGVLMFLLKEPIVLWVRPLVSCERRGIYQLQHHQSDSGSSYIIGELDVDDACSVS